MVAIPNLVLINGVQIPQLGFGTYKVTENTLEILSTAIEVGYRHIDTAQMYGNETEVGEAWTNSGIDRSSFFLTSKLDNPNHEPDVARRTFEQSLNDLRTDYVDLFLIHYPMPMLYGGDLGATWAVLEEFYDQGLARAIGVSNFLEHHIDQIRRSAQIRPMVNQIESHPFFPNDELHRYDRNNGIITEAWAPLGRGGAATNPTLENIGKKYGKSAAQVAIRWGLQRGDVLFPKASTAARQRANMNVFDFHLSESDMRSINDLNQGETGRTGRHPDRMERIGDFKPPEH
ncbi:aldo/keto reductase [Actinomycetaceae bacterium MB13-C1-2]|nr:aldo/keto reductase [Actinomycetaceae bacterium MB13-C1-2]